MNDAEQMNADVQKYPKWILKVINTGGYIEKYIEFKADYRKAIEAWEATERFYKQYFGKNRYASYESFCVNMKRYLNKKAKENDKKI